MAKRELKFRVWDDGMLYLGSVFDSTWLEDENCMQFTGLKDKNGTDIYEGDILGGDELSDLCLVGWSDKFASFVIDRKGWLFSHYFGEAISPDSCLVVGNIYENQNLLK